MLEYYPTLVEAVIEFQLESRRMVAERSGLEYIPEPDHEKVEVL